MPDTKLKIKHSKVQNYPANADITTLNLTFGHGQEMLF